MRALQLGAATGAAGVLIAGSLLAPAGAAPTVGSSATLAGADLIVEQMAPNAFTDVPVTITVRVRNVGTAASDPPRSLTITLPNSFGYVALVLPLPGGVTCPTEPSVGFTGQIVCTLPSIPAPPVVPSFIDIKFKAQATTVGNALNAAALGVPPAADAGSDAVGNDTSSVNVAVLGATPGGQVDPGYPDFPNDGFGYGGYGYGSYGFDDYDYDYCDYYCY